MLPKTCIALHYEEGSAPSVSAHGQGKVAEQMIRLARYYGVPLVKCPTLALKLGRCECNEAIPEDSYEEVARLFLDCYEVFS